MKDALSLRVSLSEAEAVIREFDGNMDNRLNFQEFQQFVLPATSRSLRDIALNRASLSTTSHSYRYRQLPYSTLKQVGDLVEREIRFQRNRSDLRRSLILNEDFVKSRFFSLISRGRELITVDDLIDFLRVNG